MDEVVPEGPADAGETLTFRNHVTTIIQRIVSLALAMAFVYLIAVMPRAEEGANTTYFLVPIAAIMVAGTFVFIRIWSRTTYTFGENELVVVRDTVFKRSTRIQYSKIASINVHRSILNHLFGTTALLFNINSSVNSNVAEATLTLNADEADRLRERLSSMILNKELVVEEDHEQATFVEITNADVILHGFFGQPTSSSLIGLASLAYSIFTLFTGSGGLFMALVLFALTSALPWIRTILRYYNYRIYRIGDTITVESGLLNTYRSSFNIKKVNSVRIREPLLARLMGKMLLEAEVVGLADSQGLPLLCPLKSKKVVMQLTEQLVPEFLFETSRRTQPKESAVPTIGYKAFLAAISAIVGVSVYLFATSTFDVSRLAFANYILYGFCAIMCVAIPAVLIVHGMLAQGNREFEMGRDTFIFVTGAYDRQTDFMRYDKVQIATVTSGIVQRRFGVGRCTVSLMSSRGAVSVKSGIFLRDDLELVGNEVVARIEDGRYDYRMYL